MPMWIIGLGVFVAILIAAALLNEKGKSKLADKGLIIQRDKKFMENAEIFTLKPIKADQLTEGLKKVNAQTKVGIEGTMNRGYVFDGGSWSKWKAALKCQRLDDTQSVFRFTFTEWKTDGGQAEDDVSMNVVLTALEKMFLAMDPNTQVQTEAVQYHTARDS